MRARIWADTSCTKRRSGFHLQVQPLNQHVLSGTEIARKLLSHSATSGTDYLVVMCDVRHQQNAYIGIVLCDVRL